MKEIEELLNEEIVDSIKGLDDIPLDDGKYGDTVNSVCKLIDKSIELRKVQNQAEKDSAELEVSTELKKLELESNLKDRKTKNILTAAGIVVPVVVGSFWGYKSLKFEETGSIGSTLGRNVINGLTKIKFW